MGEIRIGGPGQTLGYPFLTYETEFALVSAVLKNYFLAHELKQFTRNVKSDVRTINFRSDVTCATTKNSE